MADAPGISPDLLLGGHPFVLVFLPNTNELQRFVLADAFAELGRHHRLHYVLPAPEAAKMREAAAPLITADNSTVIDVPAERFKTWTRVFQAGCEHYARLSPSFAIRANLDVDPGLDAALAAAARGPRGARRGVRRAGPRHARRRGAAGGHRRAARSLPAGLLHRPDLAARSLLQRGRAGLRCRGCHLRAAAERLGQPVEQGAPVFAHSVPGVLGTAVAAARGGRPADGAPEAGGGRRTALRIPAARSAGGGPAAACGARHRRGRADDPVRGIVPSIRRDEHAGGTRACHPAPAARARQDRLPPPSVAGGAPARGQLLHPDMAARRLRPRRARALRARGRGAGLSSSATCRCSTCSTCRS